MEKISRKSVTLWRIRLCLIASACTASALIFLDRFTLVKKISVTVIASVFVFFFLFYYPIKYNRLCYRVENDRVCVIGGVFYRTERYVEVKNIQYIGFVADPLQRIAGLQGALIFTSGSKIYIPCLDKQRTERLLEKTGKAL